MFGAGDVRIETVPDARLVEPTDALVRVTRAAICGSDLWPYKAMERSDTGRRMGHEFIGVVEAAWTNDELARIGAAQELEIVPLRCDGTPRKPVTIWVVRQGDDLYVRSVHGRTAVWFRGAQERHEAHIEAGGTGKDVLLVETDELPDALDAAYRAKYRRYAKSIVDTTSTPQARAATLKLVPRP
jgi:hypothetical protein